MTRDDTVIQRKRGIRGRKVLRRSLFGVLVLVVALLSMCAGAYVGIARSLPVLDLDTARAVAETTKIYDSSQPPVLIGELRGLENRQALSAGSIPQVMRDAVVAIEDERFYAHKGVDFLAVVRAVWANLRNEEIAQGGSTITQQLIKNAFMTGDGTMDRQVSEAALAYQLESRWSKEKILNEYLNVIYFGAGAYGIQAAAREYFGVGARDLTIAQAALLAGVPQAPSAYSPRFDPQAALGRRDLILNKMYQQRFITSDQLQEALATPLELAEPGGEDEPADPYWMELVREQLVARYGSSTVLRGGLRVQTSLDVRLQQAAEEAVSRILGQPGAPSAALVSVDARTGRMVAMVAGSDLSQVHSNLATEGERQPGSALIPFVLVTALEQGLSPDTLIGPAPPAIDPPGETREASYAAEGQLTLAEATSRSSSGAFASLVEELGVGPVTETARKMGIVAGVGDDLAAAMTSGRLSEGVSPAEMALAYATLASGGERLSAQITFDPSKAGLPISIVKVSDSGGAVLDLNDVVRTRVMDPGISEIATRCLQTAMTEGPGTAAAIGRPAAGTAGRTEDHADAWFIGYTPELVTAVWVGYPDGQRPLKGVHGIDVTGDSIPAQIWAAFMETALVDAPVTEFSDAYGERWVTLEVCSESGLLPAQFCTSFESRLFRADGIPVDVCPLHAPKETTVPSVAGLSAAKAVQALNDARFKVSRVDDTASLKPAGVVVEQRPEAGSLLLEGSTVVIVVSTGQARAIVPSVTGMLLEAAQARLAAAGLKAEVTYTSNDAPAGTVLAQDPAASGVVVRGSAVRLSVSSGPLPDTTTTTSTTITETAAAAP